MSTVTSFPLFTLGAGGVLGYCVGYAAKKILKLVAIIVGCVVGSVMAVAYYLQSQGIITVTVNYDALNMLLGSLFASAIFQVGGLVNFASNFGVGIVGFLGGAYLGFQRG
jgi:uncharacterized membrane protein (Fun14 family)